MQDDWDFRSLHRVGQTVEGTLVHQIVASLVGGVPAKWEEKNDNYNDIIKATEKRELLFQINKIIHMRVRWLHERERVGKVGRAMNLWMRVV